MEVSGFQTVGVCVHFLSLTTTLVRPQARADRATNLVRVRKFADRDGGDERVGGGLEFSVTHT
jgi:hypothetical protein